MSVLVEIIGKGEGKKAQGLKLDDSIEPIGTTEQLSEKSAKSRPQGLKAALICCFHAGDKSPAYLKTEFFRKL